MKFPGNDCSVPQLSSQKKQDALNPFSPDFEIYIPLKNTGNNCCKNYFEKSVYEYSFKTIFDDGFFGTVPVDRIQEVAFQITKYLKPTDRYFHHIRSVCPFLPLRKLVEDKIFTTPLHLCDIRRPTCRIKQRCNTGSSSSRCLNNGIRQ